MRKLNQSFYGKKNISESWKMLFQLCFNRNAQLHAPFRRLCVDTNNWLLKLICGCVEIRKLIIGSDAYKACIISRYLFFTKKVTAYILFFNVKIER
jgi:hypothetical protein